MLKKYFWATILSLQFIAAIAFSSPYSRYCEETIDEDITPKCQPGAAAALTESHETLHEPIQEISRATILDDLKKIKIATYADRLEGLLTYAVPQSKWWTNFDANLAGCPPSAREDLLAVVASTRRLDPATYDQLNSLPIVSQGIHSAQIISEQTDQAMANRQTLVKNLITAQRRLNEIQKRIRRLALECVSKTMMKDFNKYGRALPGCSPEVWAQLDNVQEILQEEIAIINYFPILASRGWKAIIRSEPWLFDSPITDDFLAKVTDDLTRSGYLDQAFQEIHDNLESRVTDTCSSSVQDLIQDPTLVTTLLELKPDHIPIYCSIARQARRFRTIRGIGQTAATGTAILLALVPNPSEPLAAAILSEQIASLIASGYSTFNNIRTYQAIKADFLTTPIIAPSPIFSPRYEDIVTAQRNAIFSAALVLLNSGAVIRSANRLVGTRSKLPPLNAARRRAIRDRVTGNFDRPHERIQAQKLLHYLNDPKVRITATESPTSMGIDGFLCKQDTCLPLSLKHFRRVGRLGSIFRRIKENAGKLRQANHKNAILFAQPRQFTIRQLRKAIKSGKAISMMKALKSGTFQRIIFECKDGVITITKNGIVIGAKIAF